jgi:hypothetical protein
MARNVVSKDQLTVDQERFVRMEANGYSTPEIIKELWDMVEADDPKAYHAKEQMLSRWRKHPKYEDCWRDEVRKQDFSDYSLARKVLRKGMRADEPWLAMQSAVNTLNNSGKRLFRDEENTVTVQIQGSIDLGSPEQDE